MRILATVAVILTIATAGCSRHAAPEAKKVEPKKDAVLSMGLGCPGPVRLALDPSTHTVLGSGEFDERRVFVYDTQTVDAHPNEAKLFPDAGPGPIAVDVDAHTAYVANPQSFRAVDTKAMTYVPTNISIPDAKAIALDPELQVGYVVVPESVSVIDTRTASVVTTIPMEGGPGDVAVDTQRHRAYVTSTRKVSVIDTKTNNVAATIDMGDEDPYHVVVDPQVGAAYVATLKSKILRIDAESNAVTSVTDADAPLAVDATTHRLYAVRNNSEVVVVDANGNNVVSAARDTRLMGAAAMVVDPTTHRAWVAGGCAISVVDPPR